jgi:hypothetical protein
MLLLCQFIEVKDWYSKIIKKLLQAKDQQQFSEV